MSAGDTSILARVGSYYEEKLRAHGATARGVDWRNESVQDFRFAKLAAVFRAADTGSIAEIGCGYGALAAWLRARGSRLRYIGLDVSAEMIAAARHSNGALADVAFEVGTKAPPADFVVASGIFNVRFDIADDVWRRHVEATIRGMHDSARVGIAFNCLTGFSDADRKEARLWYADPGDLLDWSIRTFGRHVALLHDYDLYEFTLLVWRQPERIP